MVEDELARQAARLASGRRMPPDEARRCVWSWWRLLRAADPARRTPQGAPVLLTALARAVDVLVDPVHPGQASPASSPRR